MDTSALLGKLFPAGHDVRLEGDTLTGSGRVDGEQVAVVGTTPGTAIGCETALDLAERILRIVSGDPGRPILILVATTGQRLSRRDELLGINRYLAHLAKCIEIARRHGHRVVSLVYSEAVSGGYLSLGMLADTCAALPRAEIRVMSLPAMARVTKIPQTTLEELSLTSPVFAPGAGNYLQMGALDALWETDVDRCLLDALRKPSDGDQRRRLGRERDGRAHADTVARQVRDEYR